MPGRFEETKVMSQQITKKSASPQPIVASPYLRVPEAQRYLRVSRRTLLRWVRGHKIPTIKATRRLLLFRRSDLDAAMERLTVEAI